MIVGRGVEKVEGRCGGQAVLVDTRLTISCIDATWQAGGDALVAKQYPYLTREQRMAAYGYAEEHRAELDAERPANRTPHPWQETDEQIHAELAAVPDADPEVAAAVEGDLLPCCGGALDHIYGCAGPGSPADLLLRLAESESRCNRLQVEHDAMATAGRTAHSRAARAIAALRLIRPTISLPGMLPASAMDAVTLALRDEPPPPLVSVRDMGVGGPYRLFVGDHGIATWPSKPALEDPQAYAEEVARCLRLALGVVE